MVCIPRDPDGAAGRDAGRAGPDERDERGMVSTLDGGGGLDVALYVHTRSGAASSTSAYCTCAPWPMGHLGRLRFASQKFFVVTSPYKCKFHTRTSVRGRWEATMADTAQVHRAHRSAQAGPNSAKAKGRERHAGGFNPKVCTLYGR